MESKPAVSDSASTTSAATRSLAIFTVFSILYILLRSGDIFAVDGAYRCLEVYRRQKLFVDGSNHLLYPAFVFIWERLVAFLGFRPADPLSFFSLIEVMNCLAAAACLGILFWLAFRTTRNWRASLGLTICLGFSKAFLEQATNANEPMLGLLWSFTGVLFAAFGFQARAKWLFFVSGVFFALATASYQSMIFLAPAVVVLIWQSPDSESLGRRRRASSISSFLGGGLVGSLAIYLPAITFLKITQSALTNGSPLQIAGAHTWLRVSVGRILNIPIGMVQNIFPVLTDFIGIRALMKGPALPLISFLLILAVLAALIFFCAADIWRHRASLSRTQRAGVLAASAGFAFTLIPVLVFSPNYDKLWLQPLACIAFVITIAFAWHWKRSLLARWTRPVLIVAIFAGVLTNFGRAIPRHRVRAIPGLAETEKFAKIVNRNDFVVGEWNAVSVLYQQLWAANGHYIDFVDLAAQEGRNATRDIGKAIIQTRQNGGEVYFIGLLDESEDTWDGFLASRCGVPFSDLDFYRSHSQIIAVFRLPSARIVVRRLNPVAAPVDYISVALGAH